jgi:hypothetical protein
VGDYDVNMRGQRENKRINFLSTSKGILRMKGISNVKTSIVNADETTKLRQLIPDIIKTANTHK